MPFIPDNQPKASGRFVPDAAPVAAPESGSDPRTSEGIGGFVGEQAGNLVSLAFPERNTSEITKGAEDTGKSLGLSLDSMLQAVRQYTTSRNGFR